MCVTKSFRVSLCHVFPNLSITPSEKQISVYYVEACDASVGETISKI